MIVALTALLVLATNRCVYYLASNLIQYYNAITTITGGNEKLILCGISLDPSGLYRIEASVA